MRLEEAFGKVLKKHRKQKKLSQERLALSSDLDASFISKIERGRSTPTINTVFLISRSLDIEPHELIEEVYQLHKETTQ